MDVAESVDQGSQQLTVPSGKTPVSEKKESKTKVGDKRKVEEKHENRGEKIETDVSSDSSDIAHAGDERGENVKKAKKENNTHDESGNEKKITRSNAGGKDKTSKRQSRVQVCFSNRSDIISTGELYLVLSLYYHQNIQCHLYFYYFYYYQKQRILLFA